MKWLRLRVVSLCFSILLGNFLAIPAVYADQTGVLRPIADGTDGLTDWAGETNGVSVGCGISDCYDDVDESTGNVCANADGQTSYIGSTDSTNIPITFDLSEGQVQDSSKVTQIAITFCARAFEGNSTLQTRYCLNGSCQNSGSNTTLDTTYTEYTQTHTVNFIKNSNSDIEIGIDNTTAGTPSWVTQISAVLTFSLPQNSPDPRASGGSYPTEVFFSGLAYPGSSVEVLRKNVNEKRYQNFSTGYPTMSPDGQFTVTFLDLQQDEYLFALRARDPDGRKTGIVTFNTNLRKSNYLVAEDIFVPPTLGFQSAAVSKGDKVTIVGYAAAGSQVEVVIDEILFAQTTANQKGYYELSTSTLNLTLGDHYAKARQIDRSGRASNFSIASGFKVSAIELPKADFNSDNVVNITDWSVFLFRWGAADAATRLKVDMDGNGKVDIADFSIFLQAMKTR